MKRKWHRVLLIYLILSILFLAFRVVSETFQRYSVSSAVAEVFLFSVVDEYCVKNGLNWEIQYPGFYHTNYHYWSSLSSSIFITESDEVVAVLHGVFQARWFGVYLKKVKIAHPIQKKLVFDITEDILAGNAKRPNIYFEQKPVFPQKDKTCILSDLYPILALPFIIIVNLAALFYSVWIAWLTGYSWYLFFKTKDWIPRNIRIKSYFYLILLPVSIGLLIVSAVTAKPGGKQFFALNMIIIFTGLILYLIESASICRQYKGIHLSAKTTPDDNSGNSKFNTSY
jgi:hypothetical protein